MMKPDTQRYIFNILNVLVYEEWNQKCPLRST